MRNPVRFLVNDRIVETEAWRGAPALDIIRGELGLTGTKEGCREGDCGACSVLLGQRIEAEGGTHPAIYRAAVYRAVPSCLLALGELEGRHLVTIEGLAAAGTPGTGPGSPRLTPVMRAILAENGSQCGFCTPGIVVALTAYLLQGPPFDSDRALAALDGNLCRCTGYGSIRRAAAALAIEFAQLPGDRAARYGELASAGVVPASIAAFSRGDLLPDSEPRPAGDPAPAGGGRLVLGGGTDFFVRNPHPRAEGEPVFLDRDPRLLRVEFEGSGPGTALRIGSALSWTDFFANPSVRAVFPGIERFEPLLASSLVRNRATIGGNVANASPVADLTSMLIALGAIVRLESLAHGATHGAARRELPLERLFLGYKELDLREGEIIESFAIPVETGDGAPRARLFNFEKVAKRSGLDIAAVNTAALFEMDKGRITRARISAGGVAPVPLLLAETSAFLAGRLPDADTAREAARLAASEARPISDARGSADYRRRLLERLALAHFSVLFGTRVLDGGRAPGGGPAAPKPEARP